MEGHHGTGKNKQPYAIAMADDSPFALAGIWDTWRDPTTGVEIRNFAAITCPPNEMMATIHDRMPSSCIEAITTGGYHRSQTRTTS